MSERLGVIEPMSFTPLPSPKELRKNPKCLKEIRERIIEEELNKVNIFREKKGEEEKGLPKKGSNQDKAT